MVQSSRGKDARVESFKTVKGYVGMGKRNRSMGKYSWQRAAALGVTQGKDKDIKARSAERNILLQSVSSSLGLVSALAWACDDINRFKGKGNVKVLAKAHK